MLCGESAEREVLIALSIGIANEKMFEWKAAEGGKEITVSDLKLISYLSILSADIRG
jgi:hypothetical protein